MRNEQHGTKFSPAASPDAKDLQSGTSALDPSSVVDLDWSVLPASLQELKGIVGAGATLSLTAVYGGRTLYVPSKAGPDHTLTQLLGAEAAESLCRAFAGDRLSIPKPDAVLRQLRKQDIISLREQGEPVSGIAKKYNLTPRRVLQILSEHPKAA
jgi:hypothetical protein